MLLRGRPCPPGSECLAQEIIVADGIEFFVGGVEVDRERDCGTWPRAVAPKERPGSPVIGEERELKMIDGATTGLANPTVEYVLSWLCGGDPTIGRTGARSPHGPGAGYVTSTMAGSGASGIEISRCPSESRRSARTTDAVATVIADGEF